MNLELLRITMTQVAVGKLKEQPESTQAVLLPGMVEMITLMTTSLEANPDYARRQVRKDILSKLRSTNDH